MSPSTVVNIRGVSLRRPTALVLRDVTLRVEPGEVIALLGANGSGKSTLLRVLATLLRPSGGAGTVLGAELGTRQVETVRPDIGLIGHDTGMRPTLTLAENLNLVASLAGRDHGRSAAALSAVGLAAAGGRRAEHCSNGMLRRADVARLMLTRPSLALLDEAHVGLDPAAVPLVERLIGDVVGRGGAVVLVSHDPDRASSLADRLVMLDDGVLSPVAP
jgi:heme exporter protein A